jgi:hypothetical protein
MASHMNEPTTRDRGSKLGSVTRILALVTAITFVIVGIVGFIITGFNDGFAAANYGQYLLWFEINPMHNVVHLALGLIGLFMWRSTRIALAYGYVVLIGYAAAFVYGLFAINATWDVLSINAADNILHIGLSVLGLVIVVLGHSALAAEPYTAEQRSRYEAPGRGAAPA